MLFETFHSLQETLVDFARTHADWLAPLGFAFAFLKSLPLVALVIPGTALLLSIGAILGLGDTGFVPVWLAIAVGAALGDWVQYACGVWFGPSLMRSRPLRKRPALLHRSCLLYTSRGLGAVVRSHRGAAGERRGQRGDDGGAARRGAAVRVKAGQGSHGASYIRLCSQPARRPRATRCSPGAPTSTLHVMPAASWTPSGTASISMRTGMRCASRTQLKLALTAGSPYSVSYTHLDVYKRQHPKTCLLASRMLSVMSLIWSPKRPPFSWRVVYGWKM